MMVPFASRFRKKAEKETRCIRLGAEGDGLPTGEYLFLESYCDDPECDCRRVFLNVLYNGSIVATIGYGWESIEFYRKWFGKDDAEMLKAIKGPVLELIGVHTEYSEPLLKLFQKFLLKDEVFLRRLRDHYALFKS